MPAKEDFGYAEDKMMVRDCLVTCWQRYCPDGTSDRRMGGIGYTSVYPIERFLRDCRLAMIWTGTNEVMNLLIQHEYYKELRETRIEPRDVEGDAITPDNEEKVFE